MREIVLAVKAILQLLAGRHPAGLPRRAHPAHADAADVRPRPQPVRAPAGPARRARPGDDPDRGRGRRRAAGDAVPQPPARPRADPAGGRRGAVPRRPVRGRRSRSTRRRSWRWAGPRAELEAATLGVRGLLAFYGSTPAYRPVLDVEGWGDLQPELNALSKTGDIDGDDRAGLRRDGRDAWRSAAPPRSAPPSCCAGSATSTDRVCCYFPGYDAPLDHIAALAAALL